MKKANAAKLNRLETSILAHDTVERGELLTFSLTGCGEAPPLTITVLPRELNGINVWELEIPVSTYFVQKKGTILQYTTTYTHRVETFILDIEAFLRNMKCQRDPGGVYAVYVREYLVYHIYAHKEWSVRAWKECLMKLGFVDKDTRFKEFIVKPLFTEPPKRVVKRIIETGSQ